MSSVTSSSETSYDSSCAEASASRLTEASASGGSRESRVSDDGTTLNIWNRQLNGRRVALSVSGGLIKVAAFVSSVATPFAYDAVRSGLVQRCQDDWLAKDISERLSGQPSELPNCTTSQADYGLARGLSGVSISFIFASFLWKVLERRLDNREVYKSIIQNAEDIVSGHGLTPTPLSGRKIEKKSLFASIVAGSVALVAILGHEYLRLQSLSDIISQCKKSENQCRDRDAFEGCGITVSFISVLFVIFAGARICANKASNVMPITPQKMRNLEEMIEHILTNIYDADSFEEAKRTFFETRKMNLKDFGAFLVSLAVSKLLILGVNALYDAVEPATLSNCLEIFAQEKRNEEAGLEDLPLQECKIDIRSFVMARGMLFVTFLSIILAAVLKYRRPSIVERKKDERYRIELGDRPVVVKKLPLHRTRIPGSVFLGAGALLLFALHEFLRYDNVRKMVEVCNSSKGANCNADDEASLSVLYYVFIFFFLQTVNHVANIFPSMDEKRIEWLSGVLAALKATEESDDDSASSSSSSSDSSSSSSDSSSSFSDPSFSSSFGSSFGSGFGSSSSSSDDDS